MTVNISARIDLNRHRVPIGSAVAPGPGAMTQCAGACSNCNLRGLCTPCCGLTRSEMDVADLMVCNRLHLRRGESLYRSGQRFSYLYVVRIVDSAGSSSIKFALFEVGDPLRITAEIIKELRRLSPFAPEHLPEEILLTEAFRRRVLGLDRKMKS